MKRNNRILRMVLAALFLALAYVLETCQESWTDRRVKN